MFSFCKHYFFHWSSKNKDRYHMLRTDFGQLISMRMMDLYVLCDRFYPTEQGYITGERGVQIEQGSHDGPICSMWQILTYWKGLHYRWKKGTNWTRFEWRTYVTDFILLNRATLQVKEGYKLNGSDDGPMWQILSYWTELHYRWKSGTNWTGFEWWTYVTDFILLNRVTLQVKERYKLNRVRMMDLCDIFYPTEQGYITGERGVHIEQGSDDGPMWQILSYWTGLHYRWKRGTNWTGFGWWTYVTDLSYWTGLHYRWKRGTHWTGFGWWTYVTDFILLNRATLQLFKLL